MNREQWKNNIVLNCMRRSENLQNITCTFPDFLEKRIEKHYETLPEVVKERISKLKKGTDQLGYMVILKHVYTHYPV